MVRHPGLGRARAGSACTDRALPEKTGMRDVGKQTNGVAITKGTEVSQPLHPQPNNRITHIQAADATRHAAPPWRHKAHKCSHAGATRHTALLWRHKAHR